MNRFVALLLSLMLSAFVGCQGTAEETEPTTEAVTEAITETETEPETETETETEIETETEPETEPPLPDEAERLDEADSNITGWSDDSDDKLPDGEVETEAPEPEEPEPGATFTVTLDPNGGTLPWDASATITVQNGETYSLPTPSRTRYTFLGWYYGTEKIENGDTVKIFL